MDYGRPWNLFECQLWRWSVNQESKNLWIAVAFAAAAAACLYGYIQEKNREIAKQYGAKTTVVIAKQDIIEMEPIDDSKLEIIEKPIDFLEPGSVTDPNDIVGKVALVSIKKGEQVLKTKITEPSPVTGLSLEVSPGKRAVSLPVDEIRGVAKLLKPGDRIDILTAITTGKGQDQKREVKTLMQNVPVLATGKRIRNSLPALYTKDNKSKVFDFISLNGNTSFGSVTIEATPLEAQNLVLIMSENPSNIFVTLRHPSDSGPIGFSRTSTSSSLLGRSRRRGSANAGTRTPAQRKNTNGGYQPL